MSDAMSAQNTYFQDGNNASPIVYGTELSEVQQIGDLNEMAEEIDVTHLRSPGGYREFIQSFKDGGEVPLQLNFLPASTTQQALRSQFESGDTVNRKITFPDGTTCEFAAWVKGIGSTGISVGGKLTMNVTLRMVGPTDWTFGDGSPS